MMQRRDWLGSRPVRRNLMLLFLPWMLLILLLTVLLYERLLDARLAPLLREQQYVLSEGLGILNRQLANLLGHQQFLIQQPVLARALENPGTSNRQALGRLFLEFSASTGGYDQIRWLDEQGNERVRVDMTEDGAQLRPDEHLQNMADAYYFVEAMSLPAGGRYLSRFDLQQVFGVLQQPLKPTLRVASPLFDQQGGRRGVLVLNYLGAGLLKRLGEVAADYAGSLSLVDHEGYWMLAPDPQDAWGLMRGRADATLASRNRSSWLRMQQEPSGVFSDADGLWAYSRFDPYDQSRLDNREGQWMLVAHVPAPLVRTLEGQIFWQVLALCVGMLALGAFVVIRLGRSEYQHDCVQQDLLGSQRALLRSNEALRETVEQLQRTKGALLQAEKLSSLGTLVAGVAHELNTPIGAASVTASTLQAAVQRARKTGQVDDIGHFLGRSEAGLSIVIDNLARMALLTQAFKRLASDRASTERRQFDLVALVQEVLVILAPRLRQGDYQVCVHAPDQLWLDSYPGPISQVLQNLIENALVHAFEGREQGVISVRLSRDEAAHHCVIEVEDDGCGMEEGVLAHIFDPFFTTRRGRGGTGLGLHITHQLAVDILGAQLQVRSTPGVGSCFRLVLALA